MSGPTGSSASRCVALFVDQVAYLIDVLKNDYGTADSVAAVVVAQRRGNGRTVSRSRSKGAVPVADTTAATRRRYADAFVAGRSPELERLVAHAVDTSIEFLCHGGLLVPLVIVHAEGDPTMHLFGDPMDDNVDLDMALADARAFVDSLDRNSVQRYVWAYDGYAGEGDDHSDAVVMEAAEAAQPHGWQLAVRYKLHAGGASAVDASVQVVEALDTPLNGVSSDQAP